MDTNYLDLSCFPIFEKYKCRYLFLCKQLNLKFQNSLFLKYFGDSFKIINILPIFILNKFHYSLSCPLLNNAQHFFPLTISKISVKPKSKIFIEYLLFDYRPVKIHRISSTNPRFESKS